MEKAPSNSDIKNSLNDFSDEDLEEIATNPYIPPEIQQNAERLLISREQKQVIGQKALTLTPEETNQEKELDPSPLASSEAPEVFDIIDESDINTFSIPTTPEEEVEMVSRQTKTSTKKTTPGPISANPVVNSRPKDKYIHPHRGHYVSPRHESHHKSSERTNFNHDWDNPEAAEKRSEEKRKTQERKAERGIKEENKRYSEHLERRTSPTRLKNDLINANHPEYRTDNEPKVEKPEKTLSPEENAEKLFNKYESSFNSYAKKWLARGVASHLKSGALYASKEDLLFSGFQLKEDSTIDKIFDPDETYSLEAAETEIGFKKEVKDKILSNPKKLQTISEEDLSRARYRGAMYAIKGGAEYNKTTKKIEYSLPIKVVGGEQLSDFLSKNGVDSAAEHVKNASYNGFINIVEALVDADSADFAELNWYFDNFNYAEGFDEPGGFLDHLYAYSSNADTKWNQKFDDFLKSRLEYQEILAGQTEDVNSDIEEIEAEPATPENEQRNQEIIEESFTGKDDQEIISALAEGLGVSPDNLLNLNFITTLTNGASGITPFKILPSGRQTNTPPTGNRPNLPKAGNYTKKFADQKVMMQYIAYYIIKNTIDPNATIYQETGNSKNHLFTGDQDYTLLEFNRKNPETGDIETVAIAEGNKISAAAYAWCGQGKGGWVPALVNKTKDYGLNGAKSYPGVKWKSHNHFIPVPNNTISIYKEIANVDLIQLVRAMAAKRQATQP